MDIKELKKELDLKDKDLAEFLGQAVHTYRTTSAKQRIDTAFCKLYKKVKEVKGFE